MPQNSSRTRFFVFAVLAVLVAAYLYWKRNQKSAIKAPTEKRTVKPSRENQISTHSNKDEDEKKSIFETNTDDDDNIATKQSTETKSDNDDSSDVIITSNTKPSVTDNGDNKNEGTRNDESSIKDETTISNEKNEKNERNETIMAQETKVSDEEVLKNLSMESIKDIINQANAAQNTKLGPIFNLACKFYDTLKTKGLNKTNDVKLYGLYKQATLGDISQAVEEFTHIPKPKYESWMDNCDLTKNEAKVKYIKLILALLSKHKIVISLGDSMPTMTKVPNNDTGDHTGDTTTTMTDEKNRSTKNRNENENDDIDFNSQEDEFDLGDENDDAELISILTKSGAYNYGEGDQFGNAKNELSTLKKGKNFQNKRLTMNKTNDELNNDPYIQLFFKYKKLNKKFKKQELKQMKKYIIDNKIDINSECQPNSSEESISFIAEVAQSNNYKLLEFLISDCNGDVNAQGSYGHSLLHIAAANGYKMMIKMLLKRGANKNIQAEQDDNQTPLDIADDSVRYLFQDSQ